MRRFTFPALILISVMNCNWATEIIVDDPMITGEFRKSIFVQTDEYKFSVDPGRMYAVVLDHAAEGSGTYDASVSMKVTDDSYSALLDQWSGEMLEDINHAYSSLRLVASGGISTEYYISVSCDECSGSYGIQVISMSQPFTPGSAAVTGSLGQRTPSPDSNFMTYSIPVSATGSYSIQINDATDGAAGFYQDVFEFTTFSDPFRIMLIDSGSVSSYTTPDTFSLGSFVTGTSHPDSLSVTEINTVFVWVMLTTDSATTPGYSFRVY